MECISRCIELHASNQVEWHRITYLLVLLSGRRACVVIETTSNSSRIASNDVLQNLQLSKFHGMYIEVHRIVCIESGRMVEWHRITYVLLVSLSGRRACVVIETTSKSGRIASNDVLRNLQLSKFHGIYIEVHRITRIESGRMASNYLCSSGFVTCRRPCIVIETTSKSDRIAPNVLRRQDGLC
ncbi:hypothetical protein TorRG33x02_063120 [Trema orientale]|uniref:Uncharacterized protein n=1 Tax=Trema orientale TaxID=63057 RepID=A0A2P5FJP1_TREOI|nr:hypothetical protein TorRG33x02_063120 [Trema orientale]